METLLRGNIPNPKYFWDKGASSSYMAFYHSTIATTYKYDLATYDYEQ